jgi:hypothetical protein
MDQRRVELLTPALSERCSNQLSYWSSKKILRKERNTSAFTSFEVSDLRQCGAFRLRATIVTSMALPFS